MINVSEPPEFLKLLSHPLRWQMLAMLAHSDLRVQEIVQGLKHPQNLVSYHLKQLRAERIIHEHRSMADGREVYYSLDLDRVRALFFSSGQALHPALGGTTQLDPASIGNPARVLFLCTHNSARSQMAEGILRSRGLGQVTVFSAGTEPAQVHPLAVKALDEMDIDIRSQRSKSLTEFIGQAFDYIISVCDRAREVCPLFPGDPVRIHWSFPDPAAIDGSEDERFQAFRETARQLSTRIGYRLLVIQRGEQA